MMWEALIGQAKSGRKTRTGGRTRMTTVFQGRRRASGISLLSRDHTQKVQYSSRVARFLYHWREMQECEIDRGAGQFPHRCRIAPWQRNDHATCSPTTVLLTFTSVCRAAHQSNKLTPVSAVRGRGVSTCAPTLTQCRARTQRPDDYRGRQSKYLSSHDGFRSQHNTKHTSLWPGVQESIS